MITKDEFNSELIDMLISINKEIQDNNWVKNIVLLWDSWVGKTTLVKEYIQHDYFIKEWKFKQDMLAWNLRLRKPEEYWCDIKLFPLEALAKKKVIIYDDYWTADVTPWYIDKMMYWLDERLDRKYISIFTSNLTFEKIEEREKRIASRILNDALVLELYWPDRRTANKVERIAFGKPLTK